MTKCPSAAQLEGLLNGDLAGDERGFVAAHVGSCAACRQFLEQRAGGEVVLPGFWDVPTAAYLGNDAWPDGPATPTSPTPTSPRRPSAQGETIPAIPGYEIVGEIGRGGMGVVYEARHLGLRRVVALKVLRADRDAGPAQRARFRAEAEAAARVNHPNVVQVYDVGEHEATPYLAMEYVEGCPLSRAAAGQPLEARTAAALVETVGRAVHAAHQCGVVHRDLKPSNILLAGKEGAPISGLSPKVSDFGLARRLDVPGQTATGVVMGTPRYMAPEQAGGLSREAGPAADIYALGAVLYELTTGRPPFVGANDFDTLVQVVNADPVSPSRLQPGLPRDLETICLKCLEKDPARRYASALALADDLGRFLRDEPIHARPVGSVARLWRWCRRNPLDAALLGAFASALLIGAAVATFFAVRAETNAADARAHERTARAEKAEAEAATAAAGRELIRAETARYALLLRLAQAEWENGNLDTAARLLDDCPADFRHWEHRHLQSLIHAGLDWRNADPGGLPRVVKVPGPVEAVAFRPNGQQFATGERDGTVRLWDAAARRQERQFPGHAKGGVRQLAYSPDGLRLVVAGVEEVHVWDLEAAKEVLRFPGQWTAAYSPDGRVLLTGLGKAVIAREARGGKELWKVTMPGDVDVQRVAFSPDGRLFAAATLDVKAWETDTRREVFHYAVKAPVTSLAISPDGARLAVGCWSPTALLCELGGGAPRQLTGHKNLVWDVGFHPRTGVAATVGDETIRLWGAAGSKPSLTLADRQGNLLALAFSPDGRRLVTGNADGQVAVWQTETPPPCRSFAPERLTHADLAFPRDGKQVFIADNLAKAVCLWDLEAGREVRLFPAARAPVMAVCCARDGSRVMAALADGSVVAYDAGQGQTLWARDGADRAAFRIDSSADGLTLALGLGGRAPFKEPRAEIDDPGQRGRVLLLSGRGGEILHEVEAELAAEFGMALSGDGARLAVALGGPVGVFDTATGQRAVTLTGASAAVRGLAFSEDGKLLAAACQDGLVLLWDLTAPDKPRALRGHTSAVNGVAFWRDGKRLVSGGHDGTARVWDVGTGLELLSLRGPEPGIWSIQVSPDGRRVACVSEFLRLRGSPARWGRGWVWDSGR